MGQLGIRKPSQVQVSTDLGPMLLIKKMCIIILNPKLLIKNMYRRW